MVRIWLWFAEPCLGKNIEMRKYKICLRTAYLHVCVCVCVCVLVLQLCLTLCDPMDCSSPGSLIHGILQARILEWVVISCSRTASLVGDKSGKIRRSWTLKGQVECCPLGNGEWSMVLSVELTWSKETSSKLNGDVVSEFGGVKPSEAVILGIQVWVWWSERSCNGGRIWLEFPSKKSLGCGDWFIQSLHHSRGCSDWFKVRLKRSKKGRKHQGFTPGRLHNGCFIHSGDFCQVYLLFSEITVNRGGWQALGFRWLLNRGLFEPMLAWWASVKPGGQVTAALRMASGAAMSVWSIPTGRAKEECQALSPEQEAQRRGRGQRPAVYVPWCSTFCFSH